MTELTKKQIKLPSLVSVVLSLDKIQAEYENLWKLKGPNNEP